MTPGFLENEVAFFVRPLTGGFHFHHGISYIKRIVFEDRSMIQTYRWTVRISY